MALFPADRIRNVVLLGHSGSGKTTLAEALLHHTGAISRMGRVEDGTTTSDFEPEEVKRRASIQTTVLPLTFENTKINLLDTPGYDDFQGEVLNALQVADAALITVSANSGVEGGTERAWRLCEQRHLPRAIVVTRMDRENADFDRTVQQVRAAFGRACVPVQIANGAASTFKGVTDLMTAAGDATSAAREALVEACAESDDELATKYLENGDLSPDEVKTALRKAVVAGTLTPIVCTAAATEMGCAELLALVVNLLPSPAERGPITVGALRGDGTVQLKPDASAPLAVYVFKTAADPFVGRLNYFRVLQGTLRSNTEVTNVTRGESERVGQAFTVRAKTQEPVAEIGAGDVGAVAKLQRTGTHDVLGAKDLNCAIQPPAYPPPTFMMAVTARSKADLEKMSGALAKATEEDSTLHVSRNQDTGETVMAGLGETHLDTTVERIKRRFGTDLVLMSPKVAYKETVTSVAKAEYKHKKQTGGHGQYGHAFVRVEPAEPGSGFTFASEVVGGSVPREYIPAVEKGVLRAVHEGVIAGCPVVDVKAVIYDGSYHPVDSSGVSFEIAGYYAFKKAFQAASPVLQEPIMLVQIRVPDHFSGTVMGDLNTKRGRILGTNPEDGMTVIEAEVPQAELRRYATELRSLTQGRGTFRMEFARYEQVPQHLAERVVEEAAKGRETVTA